MCVVMAACAGPATTFPPLDPKAIEAETGLSLRDVVAASTALEARLYAAAMPVLTANAPLCAERVMARAGWVLADVAHMVALTDGVTPGQLMGLGFTQDSQLTALVPGGPAEQAGLNVGDVVQRIGMVDVAERSPLRVHAALHDASYHQDTATAQAVEVTVLRDGVEVAVTLTPIMACAATPIVVQSGAVNAYTNGRDIIFTSAFLRTVEDDDMVAFVVGHELAHILGRHLRKQIRNGVVSGALIYGSILSVPAALGDEALKMAGVDPARPVFTTALTKAVTGPLRTQDFEREADYLGLYLYARAGGDMAGLEEIWTVFSQRNPVSIWGSVTHPNIPERVVALRAARDEVLAKQAEGATLIPNGWPEP